MTSTKRILALCLSLLITVCCFSANTFAAERGTATIGFSSGPIYYMPYGISSVESNLNLNFGTHYVPSNTLTVGFSSNNKIGYVVNNGSGGKSGYTVSLGLSSFDNGLEGATLTLFPDEKGLISGTSSAQNPPVFMGSLPFVTLEADGLSSVKILEAYKYTQDPYHTGLGRWGFNFYGYLNVYTNTILAGQSKAVMTWDLIIADF